MNKPLDEVKNLEHLPNIGKAIAGDLRSIGIEYPDQLKTGATRFGEVGEKRCDSASADLSVR
jgi:Pathogenicity locus